MWLKISKLESSTLMKEDTSSSRLLIPVAAEISLNASSYDPVTPLVTDSFMLPHPDFLLVAPSDSMRSLPLSLALSLRIKSFISWSRSIIRAISLHSSSNSACSLSSWARSLRSSTCAASRVSYASIDSAVILASSAFFSISCLSASAYDASFSMRSSRNLVILSRSRLFCTSVVLHLFCDCSKRLSSPKICLESAWLLARDSSTPPIFCLRSQMFLCMISSCLSSSWTRRLSN
mmetsp:Transcript_36622/g.117586  ORF Transcript_36622/g.117586 Transcript_36622/m.117586 type:complete len:234 (-) Transcript_36622:320-1021(-)